ncbi:ABC transporter ATP-binding protein [Chondromyces apiculatus]|uniref:Oligopeptide transport ATP-binding protein OppF n=1 Tax=Chondromyces apiculatus DSM 436 TaxID=1192034 RepID=A0A017SX36_9BACT|nr:dipeptide ABC transporter ATP-binding protein [Chondromyces apiculatus]EYF01508.1 Oligopeptide transport ATP-binding protein OppF [Chondromyces apiculatus DSM 436]
MSEAAVKAERAGGTPLLEVRDLRVHFPVRRGLLQRQVGAVRAVDGVSFEVRRGSTLGLVGESGCGKSTTGRAILRLVEATSGSVRLDGVELTTLGAGALRRARREMQMIFQDPYASLNPRMTVLDIIAEPLRTHRVVRSRDEAATEVARLMEMVGLAPAYMRRYPHEFSGGQRQRVGIARAIALRPKLVVADEPVSALDVSIQAQILNLLEDLQRDLGLTYLFVAHDLAAVRHLSDEIAVMYLGRIVERSETEALFAQPLHPYTQALLSAIPVPDPVVERQRRRLVLVGEVPSPLDPPAGCHFHTRCPYRMDRCLTEPPQLLERAPGRWVACHLDAVLRTLDQGPSVPTLPMVATPVTSLEP